MFFFFFKQKTAYEMRISDWNSDVCSSDLVAGDDADAIPPSTMTHPPASALPDASIATPVLRGARLLRCNVRPRRRIGAATQRAPATCFRSNDHAGDRDTRVASETLRPRQRQPRQRRSTAQGAGDARYRLRIRQQ